MTEKLGPLGTHSQGKICEDDGGDLKLAIGADHENQVVIIAFGAHISWIGMPYEDAVALANSILAKAGELRS